MNWTDEKIEEIEKALLEIEGSNLSNECKMTVLKILKEEITSLKLTKKKMEAEDDFVKNGFGK